MHVVQLLCSFAAAVYVEVMKTLLPEWLRSLFAFFKRQRHLIRKHTPASFAHALRNPQLHSVQDNRRSCAGQLIDQQMHMLGHHNVSDDAKAKFRAQAAKFSQENVSCPCGFKELQSFIAAKREEVQMAAPVNSF